MPNHRPTKHVPRKRDKFEALPAAYNMLKAPAYKPPPPQAARAGADDHQKYKSRGF